MLVHIKEISKKRTKWIFHNILVLTFSLLLQIFRYNVFFYLFILISFIYIYKLSFNNKQCCPTDINQRVGGQDFEKPSLNITKKRYHKIRMYNNVKS